MRLDGTGDFAVDRREGFEVTLGVAARDARSALCVSLREAGAATVDA
jgi:hypothetical protein